MIKTRKERLIPTFSVSYPAKDMGLHMVLERRGQKAYLPGLLAPLPGE